MHVIRLLAEKRLCFMPEHPPSGFPNVLMHGRRSGANHPATTIAMANMRADLLSRLGIPELIPSQLVEVAHNLLILGAVARHDVTVWIDKECVERHVTRQQAGLTIDVIDEAVVEVGTEPFLGLVALEKLVNECFEVLSDHGSVMDDVLGLYKVEAVME